MKLMGILSQQDDWPLTDRSKPELAAHPCLVFFLDKFY